MRTVKSAERALLIFEYFAVVRRPVAAVELETELRLPQSSTSMLLRCLVDLGYLQFLPEGRRYTPTGKVAFLGEWLKPLVPMDVLTSRLEELHASLNETLLVGARHGHWLHYVRILPRGNKKLLAMREGSRRPVCTSVSGRALLSGLSDAAVVAIARRHNAEFGDAEPVNEATLLQRIGLIRDTGISDSDPAIDGERDFHALATLVPPQEGLEQYSLGVSGHPTRIHRRRHEIVRIMREWLQQMEAQSVC